MSYDIKVLDDAAAPAWDAFVEQSPQATFFHRAGWRRVIERSFGQKCHFLYAARGGQIVGVLPLTLVKSPIFGTRLVSTAWCVGGSPAVSEPEAAFALDHAAEELLAAGPGDYIEYRDPRNGHATDGWVAKEGLYATFDRPIHTAEDECLKQIPRKQRAVVRKALEAPLSWRIDTGIDPFYGLYSLGMRNHGTPVFSRRYITTLREVFGSDCDILTVYQDAKPLSSVLNFYFRDRVLPYYTGADPEARGLGAADLMYFRLMGHATQRGYNVFDFGRSKLGTGPYSFKKNWGFEPRPVIHEFRLKDGIPVPEVNPNSPKYRWMVAIWKKLPLPLANLVGPWLGKQVG